MKLNQKYIQTQKPTIEIKRKHETTREIDESIVVLAQCILITKPVK